VTMRSDARLRLAAAVRGLTLASAAVALLLGGCGADTFDPSTDRPCDFLTEEELDEYALRVALDEEARCGYDKVPLAHDSLTHVSVEYRDGDPATIAANFRLTPAEGEAWEDSRVEYKGSVDVKDNNVEDKTGQCVLVAPAGDGRVLIVGVGTDTTGVTWVSVGPFDDPCDYTEYEFENILAKLRR
jgi:hypothetical protein